MKNLKKEFSFGICLYRINNKTKKLEILLGTHELTPNRWGLLKGKREINETNEQTAKREFFEEAGLDVDINSYEKYFIQKNFYKDVGVWTYNANKVKNLNSYFDDDILKYKTDENDEIKWFQLDKLPKIHNSQFKMITSIKKHLVKKRRLNRKKRIKKEKLINPNINNRGRNSITTNHTNDFSNR